MSWMVDGQPLSSVLITRLRYLGDIVMSTIVLEVLRQGDPQLNIGYLCEVEHSSVLANNPHINRLHLLGATRRGADAQARWSNKHPAKEAPSGHDTLGIIFQLRSIKYTAAVDLFFNPRSAWLLRLSGSGIRICGDSGSRRKLYTHSVLRHDFDHLTNPFYDDILNRVAPGGLGEHLCRLAPLFHEPSGLDFLDWLGKNAPSKGLHPRIAHFPFSVTGKAALVKKGGDPAEPYLVAAPTATWESKMMPIPKWRDALISLAEATGLKVLVITVPGSVDNWRGIADNSPDGQIIVLEPMDLPDVLGVIQNAKALVTVDGGIMHAAVAMGIPTVALFGPTDPGVWFPYEGLGPYRVLATRPHCSPCHLHHCNDFICMPQLQVSKIVETVQTVVGSAKL